MLVQEQKERDFRFNAVVSIIDGAGYTAGISLYSMGTILPLFVSELTSSKVLIGLIPAIYWAAMFLPQLRMAHAAAPLTRLRRLVMSIAVFERLFLALLAPAALLLWRRPAALLVVFFCCWAGHALSTGLNYVPYFGMIAKVFPPTRRGRVIGISGAFGGVLGVACAALAERLLSAQAMPRGFAACFVLGSIILAVSVVPLGFIREPAGKPPEERPHAGARQIARLLRADPAFARFVAAHVCYAIAGAAPAFYTVYAIEHLGARPADAARFTAVVTASGVVANLAWGWASDHAGNRRVLIGSAACAVAAVLTALLAPSLAAFYAVFALQTAAGTGIGIGSWNMLMEFGPISAAPAYLAVHSCCTMPVMAVAPLAAGALVAPFGYRTVFTLALALAATATTLWLRTPEPRARR